MNGEDWCQRPDAKNLSYISCYRKSNIQQCTRPQATTQKIAQCSVRKRIFSKVRREQNCTSLVHWKNSKYTKVTKSILSVKADQTENNQFSLNDRCHYKIVKTTNTFSRLAETPYHNQWYPGCLSNVSKAWQQLNNTRLHSHRSRDHFSLNVLLSSRDCHVQPCISTSELVERNGNCPYVINLSWERSNGPHPGIDYKQKLPLFIVNSYLSVEFIRGSSEEEKWIHRWSSLFLKTKSVYFLEWT